MSSVASGVNKWRIYCNTESDWVYKWEEDGKLVSDSECFNDKTHSVNQDSLCLIQKISNMEIKIKEETKKTQGNYRTEGRRITAFAMSETGDKFSMNYDINLMAIWINVNDEHKNDSLSCYYEPAYRGSFVSDALVNNNSVVIDDITFSVINIGHLIAVPSENEKDIYILGEVISKISGSNTVVLSGNIQKSVAKGTPLAIRVNGVKNFHLSSPGRHCIGANIIGSTYIDKTGSLVFSYNNKSLGSKIFSYELEYMY